jgi:ferredoxin-NADP reductase
MLLQMLHFEPKSKVTLLYANQKEENIVFKKELDQLAQHCPQFEYRNFISGSKRIGKSDLDLGSNAHYYLCGPDSLKEGISKYLKELNVSKSTIHIEHFADGYKPWFGLWKG